MPDSIPLTVYLPSKRLLLKMMRACVGIEKKEDLWCYKEELCYIIEENKI
jgi:hypothetical protein